MTNNISSRISRQEINLADPTPHPLFIAQPEIILRSLPPGALNSLGYLYSKSVNRSYTELHMRQDTIGIHCGIGRPWTNEMLGLLEKWGLITRLNRGMNKTCLYRVSSYFDKYEFRAPLGKYVKEFLIVPLGVLLCFPGETTQFSLFNYLNLLRNPKSSSYPSPMRDRGLEKGRTSKKRTKKVKFEIYQCLESFDELTLAGKIRMCGFPPEAVTHALYKYSLNKQPIKDLFGWLFKVAGNYCNDRGLTPNWDYVRTLQRQHGVTGNDEPTIVGWTWKKKEEEKKEVKEKVSPFPPKSPDAPTNWQPTHRFPTWESHKKYEEEFWQVERNLCQTCPVEDSFEDHKKHRYQEKLASLGLELVNGIPRPINRAVEPTPTSVLEENLRNVLARRYKRH